MLIAGELRFEAMPGRREVEQSSSRVIRCRARADEPLLDELA